jgi:DNA-binding NtrC family response regulator
MTARGGLVNKLLTMLLSHDEGAERALRWRTSNETHIALHSDFQFVAPPPTPINDVERDLVLATLASNQGNRTASAHLLGVSVRTLRNKIAEYSAEGLDIPRHQNRRRIRAAINDGFDFRR